MGDFRVCPKCGQKMHKLETCCPKCGDVVKIPWYKNYVTLSCILIIIVNSIMSYSRMAAVERLKESIKIFVNNTSLLQ